MSMQYFRMDNTEGYTQEQLDRLNELLAERLKGMGDSCEIMQHEAEMLLLEEDKV